MENFEYPKHNEIEVKTDTDRKPKRKENFHREKAREGTYSFETSEWGYRYRDRGGDFRYYCDTRTPHFILKDGKNQDRFVIGFDDSTLGHENELKKMLGNLDIPKRFQIQYIQRLRTQYSQTEYGLKWNPKEETEASKKLQEELGMHPTEFILCEFISQNKERILKGLEITINPGTVEYTPELYSPLVDRFFKVDNSGEYPKIVLSLEKDRVKALLGLN